MKAQLLGFDIRSLARGAWDAKRRQQYLLRPEISYPLSVDKVVLPSVFRFGDGPGQGIALPPGDYHQQALGLWRDRKEMEQHVAKRSGNLVKQSLISIAVTLNGEGAAGDAYWKEFFAEAVAAEELNDPWKFVGFDVGDKYLTSGLSNCGLGDGLDAARKTWADRVNDVGLISNFDDALKFGKFLDQRIREHAPFFVYGLYVQDLVG